MLLQGQVGKQTAANGSTPNLRANREGDLVVTHNHGDYYQKNSEGDGFILSTPLAGVTLAATHTTATLGATATPVITVFNGGAANIAINREFVGTLSGTPGAGNWWWALATGQQASALTLLTDLGVKTKDFSPSNPGGVKAGFGKALTGLTGSLVLYKPCGHLNTVTVGLGQIDRETKGAIIVPPGALLALLAPAVGTTHVVHASIDTTQVEVSA